MAIAFTSIRHALGQLEARGVVEQVADSNTWRYRGGGSDSFGEVGGEEVRHRPSEAERFGRSAAFRRYAAATWRGR